MKHVTGYSIWLKATGTVRKKLARIISNLSDEFKAPKFPSPHVTLIEGLSGNKQDLISKTSQLAKSIKPFTIKLEEIDNGKYFKNLVILVKNVELRNVHLKAKEIFSQGKIHLPFHLTLLWKEITKTQRKQIVAKIGKKFNLEFEVKSIYLVPIGNKPEKWIQIKRFFLKK